MTQKEIIELIKLALTSAPGYFEAIANGPAGDAGLHADRMPESWIVALLMQALNQQGLAAFPEVRINEDVEYFESGGRLLEPKDFQSLSGAKIDLFIGDLSILPDCLRLRVAIELKGPKSNWDAFSADLNRLREIAKVVNSPDQAVLFAYVSPSLTKESHEVEKNKFEEITRLGKDEYQIIPAMRDCVAKDKIYRSYVYLYAVHS